MTYIPNSSVTENHKEHLIPFYPHSNPFPAIVEGKGAQVWDEQGKRYIDCEAGPGVSNVGHCHSGLVSAISDQAKRLIHSPGRYVSQLQFSLARRLSELTGGVLKKTFFVTTGAEATDGAIKLALKYAVLSGKRGFGLIALQHGFHGRLSLSSALMGVAKRKRALATYATFPGVVHAPAPYCYRCPFGLTHPSCGLKCADAVVDLLKTSVPGEAAAMILEPILGVGGVICPPDGYLEKVRAICSENKIVLIVDEVFTGMGRTGKIFAYQHTNALPDILTFAKAAGGGIPIGGFMARQEIADAFESGDHSTTMGSSNQIGLAAAQAVVDALHKENLVERAEQSGLKFKNAIIALQNGFPFIGDVRGRGLMIGIEIVADKETREPAADAATELHEALRQNGLLVSIAGVLNNVLRITPPLVISDGEIDECMEILRRTFEDHKKASRDAARPQPKNG